MNSMMTKQNILTLCLFFLCTLHSLAQRQCIPEITHNYMSFTENLGYMYFHNTDDLTALLDGLPDLHLDENYILSDFRKSKIDKNSTYSQNIHLYVREKSIPRPDDDYIDKEVNRYSLCVALRKAYEGNGLNPPITNPFEKIKLRGTPNALWQAVLLHLSPLMIGLRYNQIYPITCQDDVDSILETIRTVEGDNWTKMKRIEEEGHVGDIHVAQLCYVVHALKAIEDCSPLVFRNHDTTYFEFYTFSLALGLQKRMIAVKYDKKKKKVLNIQEYMKIVEFYCSPYM